MFRPCLLRKDAAIDIPVVNDLLMLKLVKIDGPVTVVSGTGVTFTSSK